MENKDYYMEDAMRILAETYHKILKINLTTDTHINIKVYQSEQDDSHGYASKISDWLRNFAVSGQVYEKDVEQYLRFTDTSTIKAHFEHSDECIRLRYRRRTNGTFRWVMMELLKASDYTPDNQTLMLYIQDIHDAYIREFEAQKELEYLSRFDTLTGLKNLYSYRSMCDMVASEPSPRPIGVMFSDLNGLKIVNDTMGHEKGNEFICSYAAMLCSHFTRYDSFRISGDEFLVVSIDDGKDEFVKQAEAFKHLLEADGLPRAAVGFAWMSGNRIEAVTAEAETLMYSDKQSFYEAHPEYKHSVVEQSYHDEMASLISVLTDSYEVLLLADLNEDTYHIIKQNSTSINAGEPLNGIYSRRNDNFCNGYISDDFRELRRNIGSISNLRKQLRTENHIICDYRLKNGQWRESAFWKTGSDIDGKPTKIIYYSQSIDHSMTERLSRRRTAEKNLELLAGLNEAYRSFSLINLDNEHLCLQQNNTLPDCISKMMNDVPYEAMIHKFAEEFLNEEDVPSFIEKTSLILIRRELQYKKSYRVLCRIKPEMQSVVGARYEKFSYSFSGVKNHRSIVMATRDITDVVEWGQSIMEKKQEIMPHT
ncbi:MAG: GGDEF domain-containing protein [Lachnospiraceae bacterium]|nr:GGDEF domain-containing protein [Lachnospiraceae bacterium]